MLYATAGAVSNARYLEFQCHAEEMMQKHETVYMEPKIYNALPAAVVSGLDGAHLKERSSEAIRLATVDADGWPHAAQLSVGELLALNPTELLVAIWARSHTAQNLGRDGRLTLALVYDGALLEMRARATLEAEHETKQDLTVFRIKIVTINEHRAAYADVISGLTFQLHEPDKVLARWQEQINMLRKHG
jgi:hypothetical protein